MSKMKCDVIQDLLPLYIDNACSDVSKELIEEHLQNCITCGQALEDFKEEIIPTPEKRNENIKQIQPFKKMKRLRQWLYISMVTIIGLLALICTMPFLEDQSPPISKRNTLQVDDTYQTVAIKNIEFGNYLFHVIENNFTNQKHHFYEVRGYQEYMFNKYHRIYNSPLLMIKENDATLQMFNNIYYIFGHTDGKLAKIKVDFLRNEDLEFDTSDGLFFIPFEKTLDKIIQIELIDDEGNVYDTYTPGELAMPEFDTSTIDAEGNIIFEKYIYDEAENIVGTEIVPIEE